MAIYGVLSANKEPFRINTDTIPQVQSLLLLNDKFFRVKEVIHNPWNNGFGDWNLSIYLLLEPDASLPSEIANLLRE